MPSKYLQCATITTGQLKMTLLRDNLQLTFYESYFAFCANIKLTIVQNWIEFLGKCIDRLVSKWSFRDYILKKKPSPSLLLNTKSKINFEIL